jgi:hypothetical protein
MLKPQAFQTLARSSSYFRFARHPDAIAVVATWFAYSRWLGETSGSLVRGALSPISALSPAT